MNIGSFCSDIAVAKDLTVAEHRAKIYVYVESLRKMELSKKVNAI